MKAYKFRFESVLKSKKTIVDDLSSKTARAQRILMLEMRKLDNLKEREAQCVRELIRLQVGRVNAAEVQRSHRYLELLGNSIGEQIKKVKEIAKRVEALRDMLIEAEKQKRIFEKLDEKERDEFYRDFLKKEQALLDEVGTNRFVQRTMHRRLHSSG
ncbi:flagellar export protein FliJ [Candidatus Poribacteria bacterium]|nr:flagellar export protein FliJ [Candidatus Poribacteria bacterium]